MSEAGHTERLEAALAGRYKIERKLGEGGMASVYLAEDLKHKRKVALKILRPELAAVIGAERFLSEIQTTANLQHPHILALFDSGSADGYLYYVMPYIAGETLREKLDREKQLGVEESVRIARDVADALDYAHRHGVIHRDIKPGNILLHDGRPVVADFGIALAVSAAGGGRMTETGLSLGTPHYMSPEQASADRDLSARSDVYSLGCVLYEMVAGQPPHMGPSAQSILVHILTEEPKPLTSLRHTVPPNVAAAVTKAIEKLPADRFETAKQFMEALEDEGFTYRQRPRTAPTGPHPTAELPAALTRAWHRDARVVATLVVALGMTGFAAWGWLRPTPQLPVTRAVVDLGGLTFITPGEILVSPDGRRLAVVGLAAPRTSIYVRNADEERFQPLAGTEDATYAAFSPDGDQLVFGTRSGTLQRISISGGAPQPVGPIAASNPGGLNWGDDGNVVFTLGGGRGLYLVPATGGEPVTLLELDTPVRSPVLLPGGRAVLFTDPSALSTMIYDIAADSVGLVRAGAVDAVYVATGHLVYTDVSGTLWGAPFDAKQGRVVGEPAPVIEGMTKPGASFSRFSVSRNGTLVYGLGGSGDTGAVGPVSELLVVGLDGEERVLPLAPRVFADLRWAPDGESVAYSGTEAGSSQEPPMIFVYDVELGTTPRRLTFEGANFDPVWSPDGTQIAFASERDGAVNYDLYRKPVLDDAPPVLLFSAAGRQRTDQWLEGNLLVFQSGTGPPQNDTWLMQVGDTATAEPYLAAEGNQVRAAVAPQGDLAAYQSDERGSYDIYVRSFPEPRQQSSVSVGGGQDPRWSPDGGTIYYWKEVPGPPPDSLFAARVRRDPFAVLSTEFVLAGSYESADWDLHPDGDRFIVPRVVRTTAPRDDDSDVERERYLIVTNWFTELLAAVGDGS